MKQTILVTGGTGFIGSHTTVELQEAGYEFVESDIEKVPSMESAPKDEHDIKKLKKMIEVLEDNDDVQNDYHNVQLPDEDEE